MVEQLISRNSVSASRLCILNDVEANAIRASLKTSPCRDESLLLTSNAAQGAGGLEALRTLSNAAPQ